MTLPSGLRFSFHHDAAGGLSGVTLPSGGRHELKEQPGFGAVKRTHRAPGQSGPSISYWGSNGRLLEYRPHGVNGMVVLRYGDSGLLKKVASGDSLASFNYHPDGRLSKVEVSSKIPGEDEDFSMTVTRLHPRESGQGVAPTEEVVTFGPRTGLASSKFVYDPLANGGAVLSGRIGGQELEPPLGLRHGWGPDLLRGRRGRARRRGVFSVQMHSLNGTTISDADATFFRCETSESLMLGGGRRAHEAEFSREECHGKVETITRRFTKGSIEEQQVLRFKYDEDGRLERASTSSGDWRYKYNDQGYLSSSSSSGVGGSGQKTTYHFDEGGRLVRVNGRPRWYDDQGRVVVDHRGHRYSYDSRNLLTEVTIPSKGRVTYRYDFMGRLAAKYSESNGGSPSNVVNATQYFYAFPDNPHLLSHVFRPSEGSLVSFAYDDRGRLLAVRDSDSFGRHSGDDDDFAYAVSDPSGSPVLLVSPRGTVLRQMEWTPFGEASGDSDLAIHVGFAGGVDDPDTGLVHFQVKYKLYRNKSAFLQGDEGAK